MRKKEIKQEIKSNRRLFQRKGKCKEKYKLIIETISKEMYLSQWRDGDEFKKEMGEIKVCAKKIKTET